MPTRLRRIVSRSFDSAAISTSPLSGLSSLSTSPELIARLAFCSQRKGLTTVTLTNPATSSVSNRYTVSTYISVRRTAATSS